ncbi:conserved hypothetical protein [Trichinella spiralis]|uniref:hypothetical protein n=1 Tax=Trichinella spiralis TaxID=6334 RepID=UPI0001EFCB1A|nr:conserved hypothetical protein [Trichinella spiralis]
MRGCPGKLYTNLDATQVIRTGEHVEGCRVDAHAFYHHQQLNELKRLAAGDPRTVLEIYDELASKCLHQPGNCRAFSNVGAGPEHNVLQPFEEIPSTSGQAAGSAAHCRAEDKEIRCAIFNVPFADQ